MEVSRRGIRRKRRADPAPGHGRVQNLRVAVGSVCGCIVMMTPADVCLLDASFACQRGQTSA